MTGRSVRIRVAACLGALGLAALELQAPLARVAEWQAARRLGGLAGLHLGGLSREAGTGRLVLRGIAFHRDDVSLDIGRLVLASGSAGVALIGPAAAASADALAAAARAAAARIDPSRPAAVGAPADAAPGLPPAGDRASATKLDAMAGPDASVTVAEDVRIVAGGQVYRVPRLELRGTRLGVADLADLLDTGQPASWADRLSRCSATVVRAPEVIIETGSADGGSAGPAVTVKGLVLTGVVAGRIGALVADGLAMAASADGARFGTGPIHADAVDLPLVARILGGARPASEGAPEPVFASATLEALTSGNGGQGAFSLGALRVGALRARPLPRSFDRIAPLASRPIGSLSPEEQKALAGGVADLAESYAVDHLEIVDLRFRDGATPMTSFGLSRLALDGLGGMRVLSLSLDAATLDGAEAHLTLDHAALWGVDQGSAIGLARQFGGGGAAAPRATRAALALAGLDVAVPARDGGGNAAGGSVIGLSLPDLGMTADRAATGAVTTTAHLRLLAPLPDHYADPQLAGLGALGLTRIDLSADYEASYDRATQRLALDRFAVGAADLGSVTVGAVLDHVDVDPAGNGPDAAARAQAAEAIALAGASLRFVNAGIVEKALPLLSASANVSLPVFKASLKAQAAVTIAQSFGDTPTATALNQAVSTFVDDPRSFSLAVSVPGGRSLAALGATAPEALARIVTVTAAANQ